MNLQTQEKSQEEGEVLVYNYECFLCEKTGQTSELRHAMTQQLNDRVNECALTLSDGKLLAKVSGGVEDEDIEIVEKFIVTLYDRSSNAVCVNDARLELFSRKQRSYQSIPPTRAALVQCATYHASCIYGVKH